MAHFKNYKGFNLWLHSQDKMAEPVMSLDPNRVRTEEKRYTDIERKPVVAKKTCPVCGRSLLATDFYASNSGGLYLRCKECHAKKTTADKKKRTAQKQPRNFIIVLPHE